MLHYLVDIVLALWSWPDEGHVANKDVIELWQLVKVVLAQELANLRHAVVALMLIECGAIFLCIYSHASELIDVEWPSEPSESLLLEDGWTSVFSPYGNVAYKKQWRENYKAYCGNDKIGNTLDVALHLIHPVLNEAGISLLVVVFWYNHRYCLFHYYVFIKLTHDSGTYCMKSQKILEMCEFERVDFLFQSFSRVGGKKTEKEI